MSREPLGGAAWCKMSLHPFTLRQIRDAAHDMYNILKKCIKIVIEYMDIFFKTGLYTINVVR